MARSMATLKNSSDRLFYYKVTCLQYKIPGRDPLFITLNVVFDEIRPTRQCKVKLLRKKKIKNNYYFSSVRIVYGIRWTAVEN